MTGSANHKSDPPSMPHYIWITLEASDVIELKRFTIDLNGGDAVTFFWNVLIPRVLVAAKQRQIALEMLEDDKK